jgi:hypothetical protein
MRHRILFKAALVAAMGVVAFVVPEPARARTLRSCSGFSYFCYSRDECPTQEVGDAACAQETGGLCPVMETCVWGTGECPSIDLVRITCSVS